MTRSLIKVISLLCAVTLLVSACNQTPTGDPQSSQIDSSSASGTISQAGSPVSIGDDSGIAFSLEDGLITYPYGRITMPYNSDSKTLGFQNASRKMVWNDTAESSYSSESDSATLVNKWGSSDKLTTTLEIKDDGSMSLKQKIDSSSGISSSQFTLNVPIKYDIIIPAWGGIRLSEEAPDIMHKFTRLEYPREWQAQMFLIQADKGGLLVYAADNATQFKSLDVTNDDVAFTLSLGSIPQAPFDDYEEFETVEWRMVPYKGSWMTGAMLYKDFIKTEFDLDEINSKKPDWASEIQLVLLDDLLDIQLLKELAKKVTPSKTLIIYPGWRKSAYDTAYPDYTPLSSAKSKIQAAKSLGFKVGVHYNMLATSLDASEYKSYLKNSHSLDAFTKEPIIESYSAYGKEFFLTQINPASAEWRSLMVAKITATVRDLGLDMIHLDQSLLCFNDGRGLVSNMNSMQGNIQMQKDLAEALPDVAFSGEGITEVNMCYSSFLQVHVYGLDSNAQSYSDMRFDQICPITTAIFGEYTSLYHYPAMCTTEDQSYYQAWYRAGDQRTGHIPTLMRISASQVASPNETMSMILTEAKWKQDNKPTMNTDSDWEEDVLLSYKLKDGTIAEYRKDRFGEVLIPDITNENNTLSRFITGVINAKLPGTIRNWQIYNDDMLLALDSGSSYLYDNTPRSKSKTHIYEIPENLTAAQIVTSDVMSSIRLKELNDTSKVVVDFTQFDGVIRAGEVLDNGETDATKDSFNSINAFWYTFKSQGQARHLGDRFLMHPPWEDETKGIGYSYMEFDVPLETYGNALFETSVQMASPENARNSDGVLFKFFIWQADDASKSGIMTKEVNAKTATPLPVSFDVTKFEGKTITIRIECHPTKTTAHDSSVVVSPKVIQRKSVNDVAVVYKIKTEKPVLSMLSSGNKTSYKSLGNNCYEINSYVSETVYLVYSQSSLSVPCDLTTLPLTSGWTYNNGETALPASDLKPIVQVAEVHDELRQGIFAYPPAEGKCMVNYTVTLPSGYDGKLYLTGATGLKKGSNDSNGVLFGVAVNGNQIWSRSVLPNQTFTEFAVSLDAYAGKTVLLTLFTDSKGSNAYDSAFWGDPYIEVR